MDNLGQSLAFGGILTMMASALLMWGRGIWSAVLAYFKGLFYIDVVLEENPAIVTSYDWMLKWLYQHPQLANHRIIIPKIRYNEDKEKYDIELQPGRGALYLTYKHRKVIVSRWVE